MDWRGNMNSKLCKKLTITIILGNIMIMALINVIPRGNFIGAPTLTIFVYTPILFFQILIVALMWALKKINGKEILLKLALYISISIFIFFIFLFIYYLVNTT